MLIACERCNRHFSIRDDACPFCKHGSTFSRIGAAALSAGLALGGCDAGKGKEKDHQGSAAVETKPYATVHGTVKSSEGKPLDGAYVSLNLTDPTGNRSFQKSLRTDAGGHFTLDFLEPGGYQLNVNWSNYVNGRNMEGYEARALELKAGDEPKLDITLATRDVVNAMPYGAPPARRRTV